MTEEEVQDYIITYIQQRFKRNGRILNKLPFDLRDDAIQAIYIDLWVNRFKYKPWVAGYSTYAYYRGRGVVKRFQNQIKNHKLVQKALSPDNRNDFSYNSFLDRYINQDFVQHIIDNVKDKDERRVLLKFLSGTPISKLAKESKTTTFKARRIIEKIIQRHKQ